MCSHSTRSSDIGRSGGASPARGSIERREYLVGVGRLRQIVSRAPPQRFDRRRDTAVPASTTIRVAGSAALSLGMRSSPLPVPTRRSRTTSSGGSRAASAAASSGVAAPHTSTSGFERARQAEAQRLIVLDDQKQRFVTLCHGHHVRRQRRAGWSPSCPVAPPRPAPGSLRAVQPRSVRRTGRGRCPRPEASS